MSKTSTILASLGNDDALRALAVHLQKKPAFEITIFKKRYLVSNMFRGI